MDYFLNQNNTDGINTKNAASFFDFLSHLRLILNPMDSAYRCILFINRDAHTNRKENCGFGTSLITNLAFMHGRFVPEADIHNTINVIAYAHL